MTETTTPTRATTRPPPTSALSLPKKEADPLEYAKATYLNVTLCVSQWLKNADRRSDKAAGGGDGRVRGEGRGGAAQRSSWHDDGRLAVWS